MDNPYAPPQSNLNAADAQSSVGRIYLDGNALVIPAGCNLPAICVKTGATEDLAPAKKWGGGAFDFHTTRAVARKRRNGKLLEVFFGFALVASFVSAVTVSRSAVAPWMVLAGCVFLLASIVSGVRAGKFLQVQKITATHIHILGIAPDVQHRIIELSNEAPGVN